MRRLWWLWMLAVCLFVSSPAWAQNTLTIQSQQVERSEDGYYLTAQFDLELSSVLQEAMLKGIALHFVLDAKVYRERWYWSDKLVSSAQRYIRVSYQPLTRRWRVQASTQPITQSGLGVSLMQSYDTWEDVMSQLHRFNRWKFADTAQIEAQATHRLDFSYGLDLSQLPRPLQMGAAGQSDWELSVSKSQRLNLPESQR